MKIGILTFHRAINYGAVLQCYALFKTLIEMGHDVEIIDYRPEYIEKYRMYFRKKDFEKSKGVRNKIRYLFSCLALICSKRRTSQVFNDFLLKHMQISKVVVNCEIPSEYDIIIFGSDQIWNPAQCGGLDKVYFGQFPKEKTKFISYAASVGRLELIQGKKIASIFKEYIQVFDSISVRENDLQQYLRLTLNLDSEIVCDPSFLLQKKDYIALASKPKEDNYVLVFCLVEEMDTLCFAHRIASQLQAKVIELKAVLNPFHKKEYIRSEISPEEFIGYISHARCVVTNSFHATCFSIILQKDFYTLYRKTNNERSKTVLNSFGLMNRMRNANDNVVLSPVNYNEIPMTIDDFRQKSMAFLSRTC